MITFKEDVQINGLKPELVIAMQIADAIYDKHHFDLTITSVVDGVHSRTSLHYVGYAFDCRIKDIPINLWPVIARELKEALTDEYDVVLEHTHIHVEFQPKR